MDIELINRATGTVPGPVLQQEDYAQLTAACCKLHRAWFGIEIGAGQKQALDVEFLLVGSRREPVVLQARPIRV
jgi:hypothetical protein